MLLNKTCLKFEISHLIDNCYFPLGRFYFRELTAFPIVFNPAPFYGELIFVLLWKELLPLNKETEPRKCFWSFKFIRFIDDLCTFNNNEFGKKINDIYTNKLEVKKENEGPYKASFFDLQTEVHNIKCATKLSKIKKMPFSFTPVAYLIWMAICRLK